MHLLEFFLVLSFIFIFHCTFMRIAIICFAFFAVESYYVNEEINISLRLCD